MKLKRFYCQTCGQIMFGSNNPNNDQIKCNKCKSIDWALLEAPQKEKQDT